MRGVLLVNPGSPTFPRNLTRRQGTLAFLDIAGGHVQARIHHLAAASGHADAQPYGNATSP